MQRQPPEKSEAEKIYSMNEIVPNVLRWIVCGNPSLYLEEKYHESYSHEISDGEGVVYDDE